MGTTRGRKRVRLGPLVLHFSSAGFLRWRLTSWGLKVGRWGWNARTRRHRVDIPGPWHWTSARRGKKTRGETR